MESQQALARQVAADLRGHFSHGLSRLGHYVADIKGGACDPKAEPKVVK